MSNFFWFLVLKLFRNNAQIFEDKMYNIYEKCQGITSKVFEIPVMFQDPMIAQVKILEIILISPKTILCYQLLFN